MENCIFLENHFGVPNNEIRSSTRNKIGEDLSFIIQEISKILYPDIEIEILFLPPESGSYKDTLKLVSKHPLGTFTVLTTLGTLVFAGLTYFDSHDEHIHTEKMYILEDTKKCIDFKKMLKNLEEDGFEIEKLPDEKINEVCGNIKIKKKKNEIIDTLKIDDMISYDEIIFLNKKREPIRKHKINRNNFDKYIEFIPEIEEKELINQEGVIEIISPVVKQTKEGRGISWKGIYYGKNIQDNGLKLLNNGEKIDFFMQDEDFKEQIYNHKIKFGTGDNIKVLFNLKYKRKIDIIQSKNIYVKRVLKVNEDILEFKNKVNKNKKNINQISLF